MRHGHGDPRWFYGLSREEQVAVLAAVEARQPRKARGADFWGLR